MRYFPLDILHLSKEENGTCALFLSIAWVSNLSPIVNHQREKVLFILFASSVQGLKRKYFIALQRSIVKPMNFL